MPDNASLMRLCIAESLLVKTMSQLVALRRCVETRRPTASCHAGKRPGKHVHGGVPAYICRSIVLRGKEALSIYDKSHLSHCMILEDLGTGSKSISCVEINSQPQHCKCCYASRV